MKVFDYLVIGSGCAGAMAAQTLVEGGVQVVMVDVGVENPDYSTTIPNKSFLDIRQNEPEQYRYFIGKEGEGISWGQISKGAQVTPNRYHMTKLVDKYIPVQSSSFSPLESLGYGGLGIGWGLQCWEYSNEDLERSGLDTTRMPGAYETVSRRIGISATKDGASAYTIGGLQSYLPSAKMDRNNQQIYKNYQRRVKYFKNRGVFLGRTPLALLTKDKDERKAHQYRDMDFYDDNYQSAWRPWITVNALRKKPNFTYIGSHLVISFREVKSHVEVRCINVETDKLIVLRCKRLILASGALGTARIVLRSLGNNHSQLPVLSNPHAYIPCLQPSMLGKGVEHQKLGFGQLSIFMDTADDRRDLSIATTYSYQSLMMFRVIQQIPWLNLKEARLILRYLMPALIIMIAQHPDDPSDSKYLKLIKDSKSPTGDALKAHYVLAPEVDKIWENHEKQIMSVMRKLQVYPVKRVHPGHGSGIHYAGTVPFSWKEKSMTLNPSGRINGLRNVYVADSSGFNYLPAPGLTFSLMANAHLVAENVLKNA